MKKLFLLAGIFALMCITTLKAQVTIGKNQAPNPDAVLELVTPNNNKGFLPPKIALVALSDPAPLSEHVQGMVVFNTTDSPTDTLQTGLYYNTGNQWLRLTALPPYLDGWFYMPSIVFDTSTPGTGLTRDLYQEYVNQFGSPKATNPGAANFILSKATDLNYYILDYDPAVFANVSVDENGLMTYDIIGTATDASFINIVFAKK